MPGKNFFLFLCSGLLLAVHVLCLANTNLKPETHEQINRLLKELKDSQENSQRVTILLNLCRAYRDADFEKALQYANQGVELSKKINSQKDLAESLVEMAIIYDQRANYSQALQAILKSLEIYEKPGDKKNLAKSYNIIGVVYFHQGNLSKALEYHFKSLKLKEELGDKREIAKSYNNIGVVYFHQDNYNMAREYYEKSLQLKEELGDKRGLSASYTNLGNIAEKLGNYNEALKYHLDSLKLALEVGDKEKIAMAYSNIGNSYDKLGNYSKALEYHFKSLESGREMGDKDTIIFAYLGLGSAYGQLGEIKKSIDYLTRAFMIARAINFAEGIQKAAADLSEVYAKNRQYQQAYQYHVLFKEKSDSLKNEENIKKITRLEMQYEFEKRQKQQALDQQKKDLQKEAELKRQKLLRYIFSGFGVVLALVFFTLYRMKIKTNRKLKHEIAERKQAEAELLRSMKMESLGILADGIAHDFNNLLSIILGNLSLAKGGIKDSNSQSKIFLENVEKASLQATELVKKFLTLSEGGWMMKDIVTLAEVLEDVLATSPGLKEIPITTSIPDDLRVLLGDKRQLRQMMLNILLNAHDATSGKEGEKHIHISAQNTILPGNNQWSLKEGEYIKVSIKDNGRGIPPELLGKIFDPYFSTKERGVQKGMGLGLALCYAIAKHHGGHVHVISRLHEGTTVDLYLPAYNEAGNLPA